MAVILVAEDDLDVAAAIEINLTLEGHEVVLCHRGDEVIELARRVRPALLLLDIVLPGEDGLEICRTLRTEPSISDTAVLMISARTTPPDRLAGFTAGADDYILKPFDPAELVARVSSTLRRTNEIREVSPLTGLPGNFRIADEIDRRCRIGAPFAVVYADLNRFKAYNDHYGFMRGDEVIKLAGDLLSGTVAELDTDAFSGHVGGDDFVLVCGLTVVNDLCERVIEQFDTKVLGLYDPPDVERGYIETVDRLGRTYRVPPVSIAIGVATNEYRPLLNRWDASTRASEMKAHAKRRDGSAYEVDRRRG